MRGMTMISHSTLNLTLPRRAHFVLAIVAVLAMPILLASAPAQQKASAAEDAQRLLSQCATHYQHGEMQEALAACGQALPMFRALGDRGGEATTLSNIGAVYASLGEKQKALEYYQQALPIQRAAGDRGGEAATLNNIGAVYSSLGEKQKALEYWWF